MLAPKVLLIPLDSRPCNARFPIQLGAMARYDIVSPPIEILGNLHKSAHWEQLLHWTSVALGEDGPQMLAGIVSADMVCYGGLVPSRRPALPLRESEARLDCMAALLSGAFVRGVAAFNVIMRLSITVDSDSLAQHYENIIRYAQLFDEARVTGDDARHAAAEKARAEIPKAVLEDYLLARKRNHAINRRSVAATNRGHFATLTLCQEDAAPFGFHREEQRALSGLVEKNDLRDRVFIYPGADDVACLLLARTALRDKGLAPTFCTIYSQPEAESRVPPFEDRPIGASIAERARCLGVEFVGRDDADILLYVNAPEPMLRQDAADEGTQRERRTRLLPFVADIAQAIENNSGVAVADVAFPNGGDAELVQLLLDGAPVSSLLSYAGWNTAGNTLGTVMAHSLIRWSAVSSGESGAQMDANHYRFLFERFADDWAYQSIVRRELEMDWAPARGASIFDFGTQAQGAEDFVCERLEPYVTALQRGHFAGDPEVARSKWSAALPWGRAFEVDFRLV
ncbi:MAG: hypothetical protein AUJ92_19420 [Armatimonadetes bacterium CG2_30_59_28]|nr:DUF4127 family protein [Armatimonadota bacterium]OIO90142.1 MAG: hypothetical protein AUJ92_19420 [Armatimonadetes bacterium CG2_30_59_28]PIU65216.1 MAG: hypothetical protein COS85_09625 [Armatimonadetes bacterium CG07_land_8_20_14_0_80_59_28]PIX43857.1 MAG: hypothetical protein COZ56_06115 [Armatimonadetes bacterium CG_4_8_14_3_um_filter_58_9]